MPHLKVISGDLEGQKFDLRGESLTIGRKSDSTITLNDSSVSSHHCSITKQEGSYTVEDMGSTNGTSVNGAPVQKQILSNKDILTAGSIDLMFIDENAPQEKPEPSAAAETVPDPGPTLNDNLFKARKNTRIIWIACLGLLAAGAIAALVYFLLALFQS